MKFAQAAATLFIIGSTFAFAIDDNAEKVINKCYEELGEYQDCYVKYANVSESELQNNCEVYKSEKCQTYFDDPIKYVPTCSEAIGFRSISMLNNIDLTRFHYNEICDKFSKSEKDQAKENSEQENNMDESSINECNPKDLRNISGQCSSRYKGCEYINCTFIPSDEYIKDCEQKYNNKEIDENNYKWIQQYVEKVKKQEYECKTTNDNNDDKYEKDKYEKIVNKCYEELSEYQDCYVKYADVSENELQNNCNVYKSKKCQKYFDNPLKYVPTCSEAIGFRSISMLNNMDLIRSHYNDICTFEKIPVSTVEGRCGQGFGSCAMEGYCCSKYGYCGKSENYCGIGCQPKYGLCQ